MWQIESFFLTKKYKNKTDHLNVVSTVPETYGEKNSGVSCYKKKVYSILKLKKEIIIAPFTCL